MKTENILILGGIAVAAYYLLTRGAAASDEGGGGGGFGTVPPETGPGSATSTEGLFLQSAGQETLFYGGLGYSVRESNAQAMVNQLSAAKSYVAPALSSYSTPQSAAIALAKQVYSTSPAPSGVSVARAVYSNVSFGTPSKPADVMTGMSVRQDQPFKPGVIANPIGFK